MTMAMAMIPPLMPLPRDEADKHRCAFLSLALAAAVGALIFLFSETDRKAAFVNRGLTASVELRGPPGARRLQCTVSDRRTMLPVLRSANAAILIPDTAGQVFGSPGC
jgi:hypothetical protein